MIEIIVCGAIVMLALWGAFIVLSHSYTVTYSIWKHSESEYRVYKRYGWIFNKASYEGTFCNLVEAEVKCNLHRVSPFNNGSNVRVVYRD